MKLLFDQNLSHRLVNRLANLYPNSTHVQNVGLAAEKDTELWEFTERNSDRKINLTFLTKNDII